MFSGFSQTLVSANPASNVLAAQAELRITFSQTGVSEFMEKAKILSSVQPEVECYNITPDFISEHSDYEIFKYGNSCASFLLYDGEIYLLGEYFGGFDVTSMALADLDGDGQQELYYTFSWGSGMHRSQIGYFDPASKENTILDYSFEGGDMMLTTNDAGDLCVNSAIFTLSSFVSFEIQAQKQIGTILFENGMVTLHLD